MPFELSVALRFLREGRMQTVLIVGGVALGVGILVFLVALISGLQASLIEKTLGTQPHVVVRPPEEETRRILPDGPAAVAPAVQKREQRLRSIEQWQQAQERVARMRGVVAVSPMMSGPAFAVRGSASRSVALLGIDPDRYDRIVRMRTRMVAGRFRLSPSEAVIGTELARDLGVSTGDTVRLLASNGRSETVVVEGIFDVEVKDLNRRWVYVTIRTAQNLLDIPGGISNIDVAVEEVFSAEEIAREIEGATGLVAESWMKTNGQLLQGLRSQSASSRMIQLFVSIAVAFGISSVLVVSVVQKSREIGILRAMGTSRLRITAVFLLQGGMIGLAGSAMGCGLAAGLVRFFEGVARNADGTPYFQVEPSAELFLAAATLATVTGIASAAAPAIRAARMDPAGAIRNG